MCYYEFLPINRSNDHLNEKEKQELVDLVDVKLDQEYELVVTTYAGE
jgi:auxin responsive GH3 family protein